MIRVASIELDQAGVATDLLSSCGVGCVEDLASRVHSSLSRPDHCCYGAWLGERLVGVLLASFNGFHVWLSHIAVAPDHRQKGLGRTLHDALLDRARELNAVGVVTDSWLSSAGFYHALGYHTPGAVFLIRDFARTGVSRDERPISGR